MTRNDTAFRACRTLLAQGGLVGVFPEGISHDEARLQPLRTGAARIALGAAFDDGVTGVETVAVGLVYDDKARFRSHALVRIGGPEGIEDCRAAYEEDPIVAVRSLTDRLARQLGQVAPMYDSRRRLTAIALPTGTWPPAATPRPPPRWPRSAPASMPSRTGSMKRSAAGPTTRGMRATVKLLGCTVLFTPCTPRPASSWAAGAARSAGAAAFLAGPVSGYVTVRWAERVAPVGRRGAGPGGDGRPGGAGGRSGAATRRPDRGDGGARQRPGAKRTLTSRRTRSASSGVSIERP